jgi:hypothetical protein
MAARVYGAWPQWVPALEQRTPTARMETLVPPVIWKGELI